MCDANKENSIIDKILGQMKSIFNQAAQPTQECELESVKESYICETVDENKSSDNVNDNTSKSVEKIDNPTENSPSHIITPDSTRSKDKEGTEMADSANKTPIKQSKRLRKNTEELSPQISKKTIEDLPENIKKPPEELEDEERLKSTINTEKVLSKNSFKKDRTSNKDAKCKTNKKTESENKKSELAESTEGVNEVDDKPRIVLTFRGEKSNMKIISEKSPQTSLKKEEVSDVVQEKESEKQLKSPGRRSLRLKSNIGDIKLRTEAIVESLNVKRSPRRRSKDYTESVLANAIARKEKSYEPVLPQQRLSRRIKPTAKILANKNLRMGVELQNNARLSISNDKDRERNDEKLLLERNTTEKVKNSSEETQAEMNVPTAKEIKEEQVSPTKEKILSNENLRQLQENHLKLFGLCIVGKQENKLKEDSEVTLRESSDDNNKLDQKHTRSRQRVKSVQETKRNLRDRSKKSLDDQYNSPTKQKSLIQDVFTNSRKRQSAESLSRDTYVAKKRNNTIDNSDIKTAQNICVNGPEQRPSNSKDERTFIKLEDSALKIENSQSLMLEAGQSDSVIPKNPVNLIVTKPISCLCRQKTNVFVDLTDLSESSKYCSAVDSIDSRFVGCLNTVKHFSEDNNVEIMLMRASVKVPYMSMCVSHRERLYRHLCCAGCGVFCTHGTFKQCVYKHLYHRNCSQFVNNNPCCPHCGSDDSVKEVKITMQTKNRIVFMPAQGDYCEPARINFKNRQTDNSKKALIDLTDNRPETPPLLDKSIVFMLKNIKSIAVEQKYTYKDLYKFLKTPEKLIHVIASGLDLNQPLDESALTTALHIAARTGLLSVVHILIVCGAQIDILDREQRTPLMLAVIAERNDVVQYLIKAGSDIKFKGTDGMSALHLAAKTGNLGACILLLSVHNIESNYINGLDDGGWTPLVWAAEHAHFEIVKYLLQQNANPHIPDAEQNVVVHWAALSGSSSIIEMLLNHKCDVNSINAHGDTPLHIGARQNNYKCVLILLARNARVDLVNTSGETALACCTEGNDSYNAISFNVQMQDVVNEQTVKILTNDITRGKELNPIQCINAVDYESYPKDFTYITHVCITSDVPVQNKIALMQYCVCEDKCGSTNCRCGASSSRCWYDDDGKLLENFNYANPPVLFECNDACNCNKITCLNRVVQRGITSRLEVVRTTGKGWTVRSLRFIPRGTFVAEYIGELLTDGDADQRVDDTFFFALDSSDEIPCCIDARHYGNISRFINHSCEANLVPVRVLVEHQDVRFPRIALFACKDIQAQEELGFDYGEKFWIIKHDKFTCLCGSRNCKYSIDTISETLNIFK